MTEICKTLIHWYEYNKRDLPWRETTNPYKIWVSEIILQQTRVEQGIKYYYEFINTFPDVFSLAQAPIDQLLKIWQGLGYYSRARNMHHAAQEIVENHGGNFPQTYDELKKLKGIGDYTASAISSFSFKQKIPVLDGNVFRVLSRLFGITESTQSLSGKKIFWDTANKLICNQNPDTYNQAIMEFGALQCVPRNPDCIQCPLKSVCFAFKNDLINDLPVKKVKIKKTIRYFNYLYLIYKEYIFIEKRTQNDIWKLLYQIPLIETKQETTIEELSKNENWNKLFRDISFSIDPNFKQATHILSHQKLQARFYKIQIRNLNTFLTENYIQIPLVDISKYSIPKLIDNYFIEINK